jgi:hypothetical protein
MLDRLNTDSIPLVNELVLSMLNKNGLKIILRNEDEND